MEEVKENTPISIKIKLTFSDIVEVSVISTKIGSFHGSADGGSVDAELNAWDSSSAPRAG